MVVLDLRLVGTIRERTMIRDLDYAYDQGGQWTDAGRERFEYLYESDSPTTGKRRRRRQTIPAFSSDGE